MSRHDRRFEPSPRAQMPERIRLAAAHIGRQVWLEDAGLWLGAPVVLRRHLRPGELHLVAAAALLALDADDARELAERISWELAT